MNRPGRVFLLRLPWILVEVGLPLELPRFGRPLLIQICREKDEGRHLQELGLPVLEHRFHKMSGGQVLAELHRLLSVILLIGVVDAMTREYLPDERHAEEKK